MARSSPDTVSASGARGWSPETRLARVDLLGLPALGWAIAGIVLVLLLAVGNQYGFHRDELYFVLGGRHPDWGYVDQPPFTPILSAAEVALFGLSPLAVRIAPALAAVVILLLAVDMARRFGATRSAQVLTALVLALSGLLGAGHLDETATFDILFWTLAFWLLAQLLDPAAAGTSQRGKWLALGVVIGVALENKTLAASLPATVGLSLVLLRRWDVLRRPWLWIAAAVAIAIWLPNLAWQAANGFPQVQMARSIAESQGPGAEGRIKAMVQLLAIAGPLLWPVPVAGAVWLLRRDESRPWRALGLAFILQLGLMIVVNGKSYYSAGFLPLLVAAGSIPLDSWLHRGRVTLRRAFFGVAAAVSGAVLAIALLPLVPVGSLAGTPIPSIYEESVAQVGWPELARQVDEVISSLPPDERSRAAVITGDYGEYSALTLFGSDLAPVYSGHNSTWDWGRPADDARPVVLVAWSPAYAARYFDGCRVAATIDNGYGLQTHEQGSAIMVCAGPIQPWRALWPAMRHVN